MDIPAPVISTMAVYCQPAAVMAEDLHKNFGESIISTMLTRNGMVLEIWRDSIDGSWTAVVRSADSKIRCGAFEGTDLGAPA